MYYFQTKKSFPIVDPLVLLLVIHNLL
jgi:hypothetical protein